MEQKDEVVDAASGRWDVKILKPHFVQGSWRSVKKYLAKLPDDVHVEVVRGRTAGKEFSAEGLIRRRSGPTRSELLIEKQ